MCSLQYATVLDENLEMTEDINNGQRGTGGGSIGVLQQIFDPGPAS